MGDVFVDLDANEAGAELFREMIRRTIDDPEVARGVVAARLPDRVQAARVRRRLLRSVQSRQRDARRPAQGRDRSDHARPGSAPSRATTSSTSIIFATGFDAMTGALNRIDIRGRDGQLLRDAWADGARTLLGLQSSGSPTSSPSPVPGARRCSPTWSSAIEQHVEWIGDCLTYLRDHGYHTIEPTLAAQDEWVEHVNEVSKGTMFTAPSCNSWYLGANIPGKPRVFLPYVGGLPAYIERADAMAAAGYEGFALA